MNGEVTKPDIYIDPTGVEYRLSPLSVQEYLEHAIDEEVKRIAGRLFRDTISKPQPSNDF